jgi:hypothetical protein
VPIGCKLYHNLKRRLIRDFNLEISATNLATFACGSCNELCPINDKCSIGLEEFDLDLLLRPDHVSRAESDMEVDSDTEQQTRVDPWLNPRYPDPPPHAHGKHSVCQLANRNRLSGV